MDRSVRQDRQFEGDALWDTQPVKADEYRNCVICSSDSEDEPCSSVLNRLEVLDEVGRKSEQNAVTIFQSREDECSSKRLED